jgi:hypothetical protein
MGDKIEIGPGGTMFAGKGAVDVYRMITLASGLRMEIRGMRLTRKAPTCYSVIKSEWGLKGNRQKVLSQFLPLVEKAKANIPIREV